MLRYEITRWPSDPKPKGGHTHTDLEFALRAMAETEQFQVWVYEEGRPTAALLCNQKLAHHCVLPKDGTGETDIAIDRSHEGDQELTEKIYLENGQLDLFSREVCISKEEGIEAILYYFVHRSRAPYLQWV